MKLNINILYIMLSNIDLEELSKHYKLPLIAVTMKDELPNKLQNGNYIINLQSSTQGNGTHWTALKVINNNNKRYILIVLDYGRPKK